MEKNQEKKRMKGGEKKGRRERKGKGFLQERE